MRYSYLKKDRIQKAICVILGICVACLLFLVLKDGAEVRAQNKEHLTQERLAGEVLRFHVLANSDSERDQKVKRTVRDAVLLYRDRMQKQEENAEEAGSHLREYEREANRILQKEGMKYHARAEVTKVYFPERWYGDICFPKGWYQALQIRLGDAVGHNWWCVLYPSMCFTEAVCVTPDEQGKKNLREVLDADAYELVTKPEKFRLKSYFFGDKLNQWLADR